MSVQVPKGYKQTEVGVIPEDWVACPLGNIIKFQRGFDLPHRLRINGDFPIITSSGYGGLHHEYRVKGPGVVTGRYGTIGELFYIKEDFWPLNTTLYVKDFYGNNPLFISYFLKQVDFASHSGKSGVPGVNRNDLHEIIMAFPKENKAQQAIAEALSDADALIESLEQLIAKKRQIKQGAMQELLTGQRRLPGFSGEWGRKKLGEVATLSNGFAFKSSTYNSNGLFNIVTIANVQDGFMDLSHCNRIIEIPSELQSHQKLKIGDILVSMTGNVGRVCLVNEENCLLNQRVGKISCFAVNRYFLFSCLKQSDFAEKMDLQATGGAQGNISKSDILDYEINLPSAEEQAAIENLCRDFDLEIDLLAQRLDKARQIKQSMMQELLTGRIRLI